MHANRAPAEYNQSSQRNQGWMHAINELRTPKGQCCKTVAAWERAQGRNRQESHAWRFSDVSSRKVRQCSVSGDRESETFCVSVAEVSVDAGNPCMHDMHVHSVKLPGPAARDCRLQLLESLGVLPYCQPSGNKHGYF
jgi:hypothetical protein